MERWQEKLPAFGNGCLESVISECMACVSKETAEWLARHQLGEFKYFCIPDAAEQLWLLPEHGSEVLARALSLIYKSFLHVEKCIVHMRKFDHLFVFIMRFPASRENGEWQTGQELCLSILNRNNGALCVSQVSPFCMHAVLTAFNTSIGNVKYRSYFDLKGIFMRLKSEIPDDCPLVKLEVAGYSLLADGNQLISGNHFKSSYCLWCQLVKELRCLTVRRALTRLVLRVTFHRKPTLEFTVCEDRISSVSSDERLTHLLALFALWSVWEIKNVKF